MFVWESLDLFSPQAVAESKESVDLLTFSLPGPCQPIRIDDDQVPVYTSQQIHLYGLPDHWGRVACRLLKTVGIVVYRVIELREDASPMVMDFTMEQERRLRPIHRYCRVERFHSTLAQLVACRGKIPPSIILLIRESGYDPHPDRVWNSIRAVLKANKARRYYNCIPSILDILGYERKIDLGDAAELIRTIIRDFQQLSTRFERLKQSLGRIYFPSLRFVACKLLEAYGVKFGFTIPLVRTPRKLRSMEALW